MKRDWQINPDAPDMSTSDSDWDALECGYLKPELALTDPDQVREVWDAVDTLLSFFKAVRKAGIREEC